MAVEKGKAHGFESNAVVLSTDQPPSFLSSETRSGFHLASKLIMLSLVYRQERQSGKLFWHLTLG